jgi:8-oxo-dGTP diphosphatase
MAASFGEAYYGISKETVLETEDRLDKKLRGPLRDFDRARREVVAVKRDWKIKDMPAEHDHFYLERTFTEEEMANLHRGHVPKEMEDKWFFYMEQDRLYAYRSWTGYLEYMVEFDGVTGRHRVTVNRDAKQYDCTDLEHDREALNYLLDCWAKSPYDYYSEWLNEIYSNMVSNILSAKTEERGKTQC